MGAAEPGTWHDAKRLIADREVEPPSAVEAMVEADSRGRPLDASEILALRLELMKLDGTPRQEEGQRS